MDAKAVAKEAFSYYSYALLWRLIERCEPEDIIKDQKLRRSFFAFLQKLVAYFNENDYQTFVNIQNYAEEEMWARIGERYSSEEVDFDAVENEFNEIRYHYGF